MITNENIVGKHPTVKPPSPLKKKRKPRSDKGKTRKPKEPKAEQIPVKQNEPVNGVGLSAEAKRLKKLYVAFDTYKKSESWTMEVWPCWNNFDLYEIKFVFDGVRYGYKQFFRDASLAVTIGTQYLDHRYKNKSMYQS